MFLNLKSQLVSFRCSSDAITLNSSVQHPIQSNNKWSCVTVQGYTH